MTKTLTTSIVLILLLAACTVEAPDVTDALHIAECEADADAQAWALDSYCFGAGAGGPYCVCRDQGELLDTFSCLCAWEGSVEAIELEGCLADSDFIMYSPEDVVEDAESADIICD
jgi:hypothetical protein